MKLSSFKTNLFLKSLLDFIYPKKCLHCHENLSNDEFSLCFTCFELLELIDPSFLCPRCFSSDYSKILRKCGSCQKKRSHLTAFASVFSYEGPSSTLIKKLKYGNMPYLAESLGAFLTTQYLNLNWPNPDYIVPVPKAFLKSIIRGYNQAELISNAFGSLTNIPVVQPLKRKNEGHQQAGLNLNQRQMLKSESFYLKKNHDLHDKVILLIDDVKTTGTTLEKCAETLLEGCPSAIYGLTICS